jgi:hypothetical protein
MGGAALTPGTSGSYCRPVAMPQDPDPAPLADSPQVAAWIASLGAAPQALTTPGAAALSHAAMIDAVRALRHQATLSPSHTDAVLGALRDQLDWGRIDVAQVWMLLAELSHRTGRSLDALRCWHQASRRAAQGLDAGSLEALGLPDPSHWARRVTAMSELRAEYLQDAYSDIRRDLEPKALFRIDRALAGYLGKASVFSSHPTQRPKLMFIPGLRTGGFLDPSSHPLVPPLLAAFEDMRREFSGALAAGDGIEPFLGENPTASSGEYVSGPAGASWDALFFFRHGRRYDANHARFPRTGALLDGLDLCRIDGQAPEICFSILRPHTRIEPHHGVTNARVVIHIPFQVPPGCYLELTNVGRHHWREGEPLVFDDTFEHAAANPSNHPRGILLMDAWHPELTPPERAAFRALIEAITRMEALPEH